MQQLLKVDILAVSTQSCMRMNKYILPIIVLFVGNAIAVLMMFSGPDAKKHEKKLHIPLVETQALVKQAYTVKVRSSGKVQAATQTKLVAEVAGNIIKVLPNFKDGGYFKKGDILLQIDDSDYVNAVTVAKSELEQKQLKLKEELARAKVAKKDWNLLDSKNKPNDLVSRKPHIATAKAAVEAAQAKLDQAKRNLGRTYIRAPYSGQVLSRSVDVGQYVSPGTLLGEVYAKDVLEVHLPVSLRQYKQLALDENAKSKAKVEFYMVQGKSKSTWSGHVIRSSAALDESTNQLSIISNIDENEKYKIKIGQFVRAKIYGQVYDDVYVVPRSAVRQGKEILLLKNVKDDEGEVSIQPVELVRTEGNKSIIKTTVEDDARLIITPMPLAQAGLKIRIKNDKNAEEEKTAAEQAKTQNNKAS